MTTGIRTDNDADTQLWNANYMRAMAGNFLLFFSFYLLTPLLPIYLDAQFNADKDLIGIVLSGYVIAALLIRPFSGFIVDTFNRKKVLVICFFFFFILFWGYIGAGTMLMFAIVRTLHGLPFGAVTVANSTVAMDVLPLGETQRGDRILRTQQQSGHGVCPYCRNLHLLRHRQFRNALLDSLCAGLDWILLRVTHKATLSPCNAQQAEDEP